MLQRGDRVGFALIPLKTKALEHVRTFSFNQVQLVSVSNGMVVVEYMDLNNERMLEALDFNTFASIWKVPYDASLMQPIVTNKQVLMVDSGDHIVSFNASNGMNAQRINLENIRTVFSNSDADNSVQYIHHIFSDYMHHLVALVRTNNNDYSLVKVR